MEIAVSGRYNSSLHADGSVFPHPLERSLLDHPQQPLLELR
jgi:hypothetical protein